RSARSSYPYWPVQPERTRTCPQVAAKASRPPFFFEAEDGIRSRNVTGVQTCALPIWCPRSRLPPSGRTSWWAPRNEIPSSAAVRSEERRVGKEGRCGGLADHCRQRIVPGVVEDHEDERGDDGGARGRERRRARGAGTG